VRHGHSIIESLLSQWLGVVFVTRRSKFVTVIVQVPPSTSLRIAARAIRVWSALAVYRWTSLRLACPVNRSDLMRSAAGFGEPTRGHLTQAMNRRLLGQPGLAARGFEPI
jgi:hypothetical protein